MTTPTRYGCIIFPGFQALDLFGSLDALNTLSISNKITLHIIAKTLDPVSTQVHDASVNPASSTFAQSLVPTATFGTIAPDSLDVLIVPGGFGARASDDNDLSEEIAFIKAAYPTLHSLITICTGAGLAARAGVLDGKRATTNKMAWEVTTAVGPRVKWVAHARWVADGNLWTAAGVSAGIDLIFAWIEAVYGGEKATEIANILEYERRGAADGRDDPFAGLYNLPRD